MEAETNEQYLESNQVLPIVDLFWWEGRGMIPRPGSYEPPALPTELPSQRRVASGIEPDSPDQPAYGWVYSWRRISQLSYTTQEEAMRLEELNLGRLTAE